MSDFISFLLGICQMGLVVFFGRLFLQRRSTKFWILVTLCALASLMMVIVNHYGNPIINTISAVTITISLISVANKGKWWQQILLGIASSVLIVLFELITIFVGSSLLGLNIGEVTGDPFYTLMVSSISTSMFFVLLLGIRFVRKAMYGNNDTVFITNNITVVMMPIVSIVIGYYVFYCSILLPRTDVLAIGVVVFIGFLLLDVLILFASENDRKRYKLQQENESMRQQEALTLQIMGQQESFLDAMKAQTHDYKNHLLQIQHMIEDDGLKGRPIEDTTVKYIDNSIKSATAFPDFSKIPNKVLRVSLNKVFVDCAKRGIQFSVIIEYSDFDFMDQNDWSSLLFNAFDNAIHACEKITASDVNKYIKFSILQHNEMLCLCIRNSKGNKIVTRKDDLVSSKPDKSSHGYGYRNIKAVAQKYSGAISYEYSDNEFRLYIDFPIHQD